MVQTITEEGAGTDRTAKRTDVLHRRKFDPLRATEYRTGKRTQDGLPKRSSKSLKRRRKSVKAGRGLDEGAYRAHSASVCSPHSLVTTARIFFCRPGRSRESATSSAALRDVLEPVSINQMDFPAR